MSKLKEIVLPSGAILKVNLASFSVSKDLYQAILEEARTLKVDFSFDADLKLEMFKDILCMSLSSKKIERAIWECMRVAIYNGSKITEDLFESEEVRGDYFNIMFEVAQLNIAPFTKNLFALLSPLKAVVDNGLAQR